MRGISRGQKGMDCGSISHCIIMLKCYGMHCV